MAISSRTELWVSCTVSSCSEYPVCFTVCCVFSQLFSFVSLIAVCDKYVRRNCDCCWYISVCTCMTCDRWYKVADVAVCDCIAAVLRATLRQMLSVLYACLKIGKVCIFFHFIVSVFLLIPLLSSLSSFFHKIEQCVRTVWQQWCCSHNCLWAWNDMKLGRSTIQNTKNLAKDTKASHHVCWSGVGMALDVRSHYQLMGDYFIRWFHCLSVFLFLSLTFTI